ncbi:hypothetical protein [Bradyrhizobium sp. Ash2021]|nr:hypothetical protein [Bradyrhizobium sp. Ash2021]WMT70920.1 hypothetical protein NL528_22635 [Bradyrhizobium sp. Ash2021]
MQALIDTIKADTWPFIAGGIVLVVMILSGFFGNDDGTEFPDISGWD